jgi:alpha-1,6-mannosyltransferase
MTKQRALQAAFVIFSLAGYIWLGYLTIRTSFIQVLLLYSFLFALYLLIVLSRAFSNNWKIAIGAALIFRISLLFMTPNLSDDYFRFIWDGLFFAHSYNPYLVLPSAFIQNGQAVQWIDPAFYAHLNSQNYYTVYPPVCQFVFGLSAKIWGGNLLANIISLRIFILATEVGTLTFLGKTAKLLGLPTSSALLYAFNPLVIMELTGNLHPEAFMIFFLLLSVYLLIRERQIYSALSFALAVGSKLIPLIFLPLLIKRLGLRKSLVYFAVVGAAVLLFFAPFLNFQSVSNFLAGLSLYFNVFEFNASLYYIVRWVGYMIKGYDTIAVTGVALSFISLLAIIAVAWRQKVSGWQSIFTGMLFCLTIYLFCATIVHPWYLTPLVMFSVFTRYKFAILWSGLIVLSYSAYQTVPYSENLWLVAIEYVGLAAWMVWELWFKKALKAPVYTAKT